MSYQVSEADVRRLFTNMNYDIEGFDAAKLERKLQQLPAYVKDGDPLTDTDDLNLRDEILEHLQKGEHVGLQTGTATLTVAKETITETTTAVLEMPSDASPAPAEASNGSQQPATTPTKRGRKPKQTGQETPKTTRQATEKPKRAAGAPGAFRTTQPQIFGQSPVLVARWLGYAGFKLPQAKAVLAHYKVEFKDETLRTYLTDGRRVDEKYGKRAVLTPEQEAELQALKPALEEKLEPVTAQA